MPFVLDPFEPHIPPVTAKKLRIDSLSLERLYPGAHFEWWIEDQKVYLITPPKEGRSTGDGTLLAEKVTDTDQVKNVVTAYAQGFAHALGERGRDRKD